MDTTSQRTYFRKRLDDVLRRVKNYNRFIRAIKGPSSRDKESLSQSLRNAGVDPAPGPGGLEKAGVGGFGFTHTSLQPTPPPPAAGLTATPPPSLTQRLFPSFSASATPRRARVVKPGNNPLVINWSLPEPLAMGNSQSFGPRLVDLQDPPTSPAVAPRAGLGGKGYRGGVFRGESWCHEWEALCERGSRSW
jgi:hypothetical protein